jgi:serine/threonine-protein kinase
MKESRMRFVEKRRRVAARVVLVGAILLASLGIAVQPALAWTYTWTETGHIQNWATGRCLDSNTAGDVYTLPCQAGNGWQTWTMYGRVNGYVDQNGYPDVTLKNQTTGRCLKLFDDTDIGFGLIMRTWPCDTSSNPNPAQVFTARGPNLQNVQFVNIVAEACVDSNAAGQAYPLRCNYGTYQTWRVIMT